MNHEQRDNFTGSKRLGLICVRNIAYIFSTGKPDCYGPNANGIDDQCKGCGQLVTYIQAPLRIGNFIIDKTIGD